MAQTTVRLTMAQALVRYLCSQFIDDDGVERPLFAGCFAIFGHGNVTCLGEALEAAGEALPTWRGQNEQSMTMAAIAYAKAKRRRQIMVAASSIGPGATNMITAAAAAHSNRLPLLLLAGDVFAGRRPDPVLQQVENFGDPTLTVNDGFKPVSRYWDRITHPGQILNSLPQAVATMLDPATCGPAFIGLCQDTQELAFDYPEAFFVRTVHRIARPRPDRAAVADAVAALSAAKRPLIIAGGGVRYSLAEAEVMDFARRRGIPVTETIAGKGTMIHGDPLGLGLIGVLGSSSANGMAGDADLVLAIGTRLQDFITGSWTVFSPEAQIVAINTARFDAVKHRALPVVGDARETLIEIDAALGGWAADPSWLEQGRQLTAEWDALVDRHQAADNSLVPSYAQVVGVVNRLSQPEDMVLTSAGGIVGELTKGWRCKGIYGFDCEMGSSTMGYELAGGWGAAMAREDGEVFVMLGDGSYMMMNSDIYSAVLAGHKMTVIVCDNGGYAVINRLQTGKGNKPFNNLIADCRVKEPFAVDFAAHAAAMGAASRTVESLIELEDALTWAREQTRTTVISIKVAPDKWVPGDAWWDVGVPEVSERAEIRAARGEHAEARKRQRYGV
ncbi:3D-(3,5/4)-trihydroxycyclohexane-1,2-dione acylhydrolase (decyclizing) [Tropicimonas sp.]|uniref:3D-(3,5/4)-trihydroxycyclohexane-1,2-dione acylhydrolase (decyclizing) n=1 Tax=Tropicimonas sp. TaxID=2067044 RepID=UPI003A895CDA